MDTSHVVDRNRATVDEFFRALRRGDKGGLRAVFEPDAVWNVPQYERTPSPRGAEDIIALLTGAPLEYYRPETASFEFAFLVVDEHHAAVQFRMRCTTSRNTPYDNLYAFTFRFVDGRIAEGWEHTDTAYWVSAVRGPETNSSSLEGI
jgi:ketosteroid isomerase-like protein